MDIWEELYEKARVQYHPGDVTPFVYAHNVVCALECENGEIYTGFCIGIRRNLQYRNLPPMRLLRMRTTTYGLFLKAAVE